MGSKFERYLSQIGNEITVKDRDRVWYTKTFDGIRDYVLDRMRQSDNAFRQIFKGASLFGSYANNVRIRKPSEFDVHLCLSFPFKKYLIVDEDEDRPGFVNLDLSDVVEEMENVNANSDFHDILIDLIDEDNNFLIRGRLQRWIEEIIENALYKAECINGHFGDKYRLEYSKRGLAHTIYAHHYKFPERNISIDFVPAIMFGENEWMDIRNDHPFRYKCDCWYAIPKPAGGPKHTRRYTFMICCPKVEHDLLLRRQNLKVVYRLLKALRDKKKMPRLKSYFFTTIFLWEIEKLDERFWFQPLTTIFLHMLDVLCDYFEDEFLPFFWNRELNLLQILYQEEIEDYHEKLCNAYNTLNSYCHQPNLRYNTCRQHFKVSN